MARRNLSLKEKRKRGNRRRRSSQTARPALEPAGPRRYGSREILRDLVKGLAFIGLVLSIKLMIERTGFGKQLELASYNLLQTQLSSKGVPVSIVNISELAPQEFNVDGVKGTATPRDALRDMIEAIAEQHPRAIGVDIDFSPDEAGHVYPRDPDFFQFCLDVHRERGVPVFLGIKRTIPRPRSEWLGAEEYAELAANILVPRDSRRMLSLIRPDDNPGGAVTRLQPGKSMSVLLADAYGQPASDGQGWFHNHVLAWLDRSNLVEKSSEKPIGQGVIAEDFLIDFSPLDSIESIATTNVAVLRDPSQRKRLEGNVVLLGDATLGKASDTFVVPGRPQPYPGVLLHACAVYTLIKAPLYEVTWKGRIAADVALSGAVLLSVVFLSLYYYRKEKTRKVAAHRLHGFFTFLVVLIAFVAGVVFVRDTRVMWTDFFLAFAALIFHPSVERHLESAWKHIRKGQRPSFRDLALEGNDEQHR
jgi:CHASE2 domain-containing sensor protein